MSLKDLYIARRLPYNKPEHPKEIDVNWKHWLLISTTYFVMACGQDHGNNAPRGTALGTGGPAATSGPSKPSAGGGDPHASEKDPHSAGEKPEDPLITVHLMHKFMGALSEKPLNAEPAPEWQPLLADANNPITCADCHPKNGKMMAEKFNGKDRPAGTDTWEKNTPFMKGLMAKWMKRANETPAVRAKLKADLKCTSCHAKVPS